MELKFKRDWTRRPTLPKSTSNAAGYAVEFTTIMLRNHLRPGRLKRIELGLGIGI